MGITAETIVGIVTLLVMCVPTLPFLWRFLRNKRLSSTGGQAAQYRHRNRNRSSSPLAEQRLQHPPSLFFTHMPYAYSSRTHTPSTRFQYASTEWVHHHDQAQLSLLESGMMYTTVSARLFVSTVEWARSVLT
ncbi:hypothetical protein AYO21_01993 [Fonsecaea monophora]|uniref:Uncharacterized protein n=1 Tax=Fonsecaea monophora TaxID=254056 RepID=A0A177FJ80_9EURO|nr:hypothetical protein AYO21_01993 [Fonsecaea monophora]KAH0844685.1 hypothetical protein FOPE_10025 [Fonsecaea pedrosoi]OAG43766.1 hypothetical protein AYO21_01993 [Fonsecaea monophora]